MGLLRSWREQKAMLKVRFPSLTEEDFNFGQEDRERMLAQLGAKLNKTKVELELLFAELQLY